MHSSIFTKIISHFSGLQLVPEKMCMLLLIGDPPQRVPHACVGWPLSLFSSVKSRSIKVTLLDSHTIDQDIFTMGSTFSIMYETYFLFIKGMKINYSVFYLK